MLRPESITPVDLQTIETERVRVESRAKLPVSIEDAAGTINTIYAEMVTFAGAGFERHFALYKAPPSNEPPLVRVHSACLTGEILRSRKCDCGPQLEFALDLILIHGGALIYLDQEGRGIGLASKIRAYALQDRGLDTFDANRVLGFPDDSREFEPAAEMLLALGLPTVRLITNNPVKEQALRRHGVKVVERVPTPTFFTAENRLYLETKRLKAGHLLDSATPNPTSGWE